MKRNVVRIDGDKCNGCGLCVDACAEGAIQLVGGKARLVSDVYCDGLGACLGECPQGAITIEEREAGGFDLKAVHERLEKIARHGGAEKIKPHQHSGACPGAMAFEIKRDSNSAERRGQSANFAESELAQWPVQLKLLPVNAPYWNEADILVCADCVPLSFNDFHGSLLAGKKIAIACPKLDDCSDYVEKLTAIFRGNSIRSVTAARMEVPCCGGIVSMARKALDLSGKEIPFKTVIVGIDGRIKS